MIVRAAAGDFAIDAMQKEAMGLMIPPNKHLDYISAQLERKEAQKQLELELERMEAQMQLQLEHTQKQLELEKNKAQKQLELERNKAQKQLELERNKAQMQLELERNKAQMQLQRAQMEMNITRTGILWKLKTQTQKRALDLFLFDCWERMRQFTEDEIRQIRLKIDKFPLDPANTIVSDGVRVFL